MESLKCPNCGATINKEQKKCEYCDTEFNIIQNTNNTNNQYEIITTNSSIFNHMPNHIQNSNPSRLVSSIILISTGIIFFVMIVTINILTKSPVIFFVPISFFLVIMLLIGIPNFIIGLKEYLNKKNKK